MILFCELNILIQIPSLPLQSHMWYLAVSDMYENYWYYWKRNLCLTGMVSAKPMEVKANG